MWWICGHNKKRWPASACNDPHSLQQGCCAPRKLWFLLWCKNNLTRLFQPTSLQNMVMEPWVCQGCNHTSSDISILTSSSHRFLTQSASILLIEEIALYHLPITPFTFSPLYASIKIWVSLEKVLLLGLLISVQKNGVLVDTCKSPVDWGRSSDKDS